MTLNPIRQTELGTDLRILEIAADHLRRHGAKRTTIVAIAEQAGMSHANVYRYYPSKDGLVDAVSAQWLKPIEAELRIVADGPDPAYDKLERLLLGLFRAYRNKLDSDPALFKLFVDAVENNRIVARKHRNRLQGEVQRIIEEGMSSRAFRVEDLRLGMALVFDMANRFVHPIAIQLDRETPGAEMQARAGRVFKSLCGSLTNGRF